VKTQAPAPHAPVPPQAPQTPTPAATAPAVTNPAPAPKVEIPPAPQPAAIVRHEGEMMPPVPAPQAAETFSNDSGLPQAESLAADDVARSRAEREAKLVMQKPRVIEAPVSTPAPVPAKSADQPKVAAKEQLQTKPAEKVVKPPKEKHKQ